MQDEDMHVCYLDHLDWIENLIKTRLFYIELVSISLDYTIYTYQVFSKSFEKCATIILQGDQISIMDIGTSMTIDEWKDLLAFIIPFATDHAQLDSKLTLFLYQPYPIYVTEILYHEHNYLQTSCYVFTCSNDIEKYEFEYEYEYDYENEDVSDRLDEYGQWKNDYWSELEDEWHMDYDCNYDHYDYDFNNFDNYYSFDDQNEAMDELYECVSYKEWRRNKWNKKK
jgi:hypothetical protein